ncbi:hypothetical protein N9D31_03180 [Oligoflexaceae bacterium]|nr:hypothetical protein [Oligoflexaceae bacterium]
MVLFKLSLISCLILGVLTLQRCGNFEKEDKKNDTAAEPLGFGVPSDWDGTSDYEGSDLEVTNAD